MFGRVTIRLGIGPHSSILNFAKSNYLGTATTTKLVLCHHTLRSTSTADEYDDADHSGSDEPFSSTVTR